MNPEIIREIEDILRSMRQAYNNQDMKSYRSFFWTNPRFLHVDSSGRVDKGWGAFEEVLDQEFRYLDKVDLTVRGPQIQVFEDKFAVVFAEWRLVTVDPSGREQDTGGHVTYSLVRFGKDWKIVKTHYASLEQVPNESGG
ncbi:MAG: hypothetical protein CMJ85_01170 [Planctomycetes bacterium]|jgi:uncharacterized protein (TIGR02246 family)|nr:hypothetical protein [Planctomycetota bacterium]